MEALQWALCYNKETGKMTLIYQKVAVDPSAFENEPKGELLTCQN